LIADTLLVGDATISTCMSLLQWTKETWSPEFISVLGFLILLVLPFLVILIFPLEIIAVATVLVLTSLVLYSQASKRAVLIIEPSKFCICFVFPKLAFRISF